MNCVPPVSQETTLQYNLGASTCRKLAGTTPKDAMNCVTYSLEARPSAAGDVASAVESTWQDAAAQIKTVMDNVVFPALDMILAIAFFTKLGMAYFDYRKHGQFEWTGPVILFACLVFTLTAPLYIWGIIGL